MKTEKPKISEDLKESGNLEEVIRKAQEEERDVKDWHFLNAVGIGAAAGDSDFLSCLFENCRLTESGFGNRYFADAVFSNCDLSNADFSKCLFRRVRFENCKALGTNFSEATFESVVIRSSVCT